MNGKRKYMLDGFTCRRRQLEPDCLTAIRIPDDLRGIEKKIPDIGRAGTGIDGITDPAFRPYQPDRCAVIGFELLQFHIHRPALPYC